MKRYILTGIVAVLLILSAVLGYMLYNNVKKFLKQIEFTKVFISKMFMWVG